MIYLYRTSENIKQEREPYEKRVHSGSNIKTIYYKPQTKQEFDALIESMKVGDMIFSKWVFQASGGIWYTMGLMDKHNPDTKMLFPNIVLGEELSKSLSRWGLARMEYLKEHDKFLTAQMVSTPS